MLHKNPQTQDSLSKSFSEIMLIGMISEYYSLGPKIFGVDLRQLTGSTIAHQLMLFHQALRLKVNYSIVPCSDISFVF